MQESLSTVEGSQSPNKSLATSCSECRRRKQKCNRQEPCNHCLKRRVPSSCVYVNSPASRLAERSDDGHPNVLADSHEQDLEMGNDTETSQTASDLGYSLLSESNNLNGLRQLLNSEDEFVRVSSTHSRSNQVDVRTLIAKLPKRSVLDELIAYFFANVNWHYDIVERFYFDDLLSRWYTGQVGSVKYLSPKEILQELRYFPALLFQILAHSVQFLPLDSTVLKNLSENELRASERYSDIGDEIVGLLGRQGLALTAVQADLLRASYSKNVGKGTEAWFNAGNAIRQAQQLGLHRHRELRQPAGESVEATLSLVWYNEYKKRIWINLFAWDSLMAMILGRPRLVNIDDCDAKAPIDCNIPKQPSKTIPMTMLADGYTKVPTSVSSNLYRYVLAGKVHEMRALKLDRPHPKDPSVIQIFHDQIVLIMDNAPPILRAKYPDTSWDSQFPYLTQQREELFTLSNLLLTTLHRPHIATRGESRLAATQAAIATLESQQRLFELSSKNLYKLFSLSFYTIDAAMLLSVIAALYPSQSTGFTSQVDHLLQQAIDRLSVMEPFNLMASTGLNIVRRCYRRLKETFESSTTASSRTALQNLQKELAVDGSQEDSQTDPFSHSGQMDIDFSTPEFPETTGDFLRTYWLEQLNQLQPSEWMTSEPECVWDPSSFN